MESGGSIRLFFFLSLIRKKKKSISSVLEGFLHGLAGKESTCNARAQETSLIPGSGRFPGRGKGNSLQYSCLENPIDRGAWGPQSQGLQRVRYDWAQHRVQLSPLLLCFWLPESSSINYGIYPAPDRKTVYCWDNTPVIWDPHWWSLNLQGRQYQLLNTKVRSRCLHRTLGVSTHIA